MNRVIEVPVSLVTDTTVLSPEKVLIMALIAAPGRTASAEWLSDFLTWGLPRVEKALRGLKAAGRLNYEEGIASFVVRTAPPVQAVVDRCRGGSGEAAVLEHSRERAAIASEKRKLSRTRRENELFGNKESRDLAEVSEVRRERSEIPELTEKGRKRELRGIGAKIKSGAFQVEEWFRTWVRENVDAASASVYEPWDGASLKLAATMIQFHGMETMERLVLHFLKNHPSYGITGFPNMRQLYGFRERVASEMVGYKGKKKVKQGDFNPETAAKCPKVGW